MDVSVDLVLYNLFIHILDFSCLLFWMVVRLFSLFVFIGQWSFHLLEFVYCSLNGVSNYLPTCNKGFTLCAIDAGEIVIFHLSEFYAKFRAYMSIWELIAVCAWTVVVVRSPELRKIVMSCCTFLISGSFAILSRLVVSRRTKTDHDTSSNKLTPFKVLAFLVRISFGTLRGFVRLFLGRKKRTTWSMKTVDSTLSCIVCYERPKCVLFMPCKHVCLCVDCSNRLMSRQRLCPLCRRRVSNSTEIYI